MQGIHCLLATVVAAAPWLKIGPHNIGDDVRGQGYAGTLADAVSPLSNPDLIYTGGHNNGAASGVLKSTDRGKTWIPCSNGLWDTVVASLIIVDEAGDHVLAGTPTGIYETRDGASLWRLMPGSAGIGWARSMKNGTVNGEPHVLAGVDSGIATWNRTSGGNWSVIKAPQGTSVTRFITVADVLPSSVVGVCLAGWSYLIAISGSTSATWKNTSLNCLEVAIDPNNKDHFIYSNISRLGKQTWESLDGGKTHRNLHNHFPWHVAIDRRGWMYGAAEAGAHFSTNGGKNWSIYQYTTTQRGTNKTGSRIPQVAPCSADASVQSTRPNACIHLFCSQDFQRIITDFAGRVALVSDQGLFIQPDGDSIELIGASGNLSNNIAISPAISYGNGKNRYIVTTAWDWGPLASWDDGAHWPGWDCTDCEGPGYTHGGIGEGGFTHAFGKSNHVLMIHHSNVLHSSHGGKNFTLVRAPASMPWPIYTKREGSRSEPDGRVFIIMSVPPPDASEAAAWVGAKLVEETEDEEEDDNADKTGWARGTIGGGQQYIIKNSNYGAGEFDNQLGWVWGAALPAHLTGCALTTSPVDGGAKLYAVTPTCIATSTDEGATWSACWKGLEGQPIHTLVIKDESTMFVLRKGLVPLRTRDAGKSWIALDSFAPIASTGFAFDLSWSGKTIMVHGFDQTKIAQGIKAVFVWRSIDGGDTFIDETDDVVSNHIAGGYWYDDTFYLTSSGQGIMAKVFE